MKLTVAQRLMGLLGLALAGILIVGGAGVFALDRLIAANAVSRSFGEALRNQMQADMMHDALHGDVLGALLAGSAGDTSKQAAQKEALDEHVANFEEMVRKLDEAKLAPELASAITAVKPQLEAYIASARATSAAAFSDHAQAQTMLADFSVAFSNLEGVMEKLGDLIQEHNSESSTAAISAAHTVRWNLIALVALSVPLLLVCGFLTVRTITVRIGAMRDFMRELASGDANLSKRIVVGPADEIGQTAGAFNTFMETIQAIVITVRDNSQQVAVASGQLSGTAAHVKQRVQAQCEAAVSTSAAVEQVTASIASVAQSADEVRILSNSSLQRTRDGNASVGQLVSEIVRIESAVNAIATSVNEFVNSTNDITSMTKQVRDIAEQTNLLALNAAIEAARAGDLGRGFAVVADEVRNLAEKSAESAGQIDRVTATLGQRSRDVEETIAQGLQALEVSRHYVTNVESVLSQADGTVTDTSKGVANIAELVKDQTSASNEIARNVQRFAQMAQETETAIDETAISATVLDQLAHNLNEIVGRFKVTA